MHIGVVKLQVLETTPSKNWSLKVHLLTNSEFYTSSSCTITCIRKMKNKTNKQKRKQ